MSIMTMLVSPQEWICMPMRWQVMHEMVLPADQIGSFRIKGKVADLGQHRVDQAEWLTKLTAGDVHD